MVIFMEFTGCEWFFMELELQSFGFNEIGIQDDLTNHNHNNPITTKQFNWWVWRLHQKKKPHVA
jgi:hypothetical protein